MKNVLYYAGKLPNINVLYEGDEKLWLPGDKN